ncbi:MAG: DNA adenine methylase, partial [Neisseriaceae bacterium]|nr:DNA adenine methylase [Neisseriaceae bacterium]
MPFQIWNRRYTGSKYKLVSWIDGIIKNNCKGSSFCDIFAGTGVVAATEIMQFKKILLNDFLHSNYIIYQAFFQQNSFDINKMVDFIYNIVNIKKIEDNFLSINYGNKYFSYNDAKIIGHIRNEIETNKNIFNEKEYAILLSSLIYSADKVAN